MRPRKFIHKNVHKRRSFRSFKKSNLVFGVLGLFILTPLRLSNKNVFRYKLFLKKSSRKFDKTLRFVWFKLFPHLPFSKKVSGSRMGKGKGKAKGWVADIPSGLNLFEFKNLRYGRAVYFCNQIRHKLPVKSRIVSRFNFKTISILKSSKKINYDVFW